MHTQWRKKIGCISLLASLLHIVLYCTSYRLAVVQWLGLRYLVTTIVAHIPEAEVRRVSLFTGAAQTGLRGVTLAKLQNTTTTG